MARSGIADVGSLSIMLSMIAMSNGFGLRCISSRRDFCHQRDLSSSSLPSLLIPPPPLQLERSSSREEGGGAGKGWKTTAGTSREEEDKATSNDEYDNAAGNNLFVVGTKLTHVKRWMAR